MSDAHESVRNLLGLYCERMDAADWDGVGALFASGALAAPDGTELARGQAAVSAFYAATVRTYDGSPRTRHLTSNPVIDVDGDTATCRSSFVVLQQPPDGDLSVVAAGRYRDTFRRSEAWEFAERVFLLDQTGDLSAHLGGAR